MWADVVPILLFISAYLLVFLLRIARFGWLAAAGLFLLFQTVDALVQQTVPTDFINGSIAYVPAVAVVLLIAAHMRATARSGHSMVAWAGGLLLVSVTLRSLDLAVCAALPSGTHFLWHLLNALALYLLIRGAGVAIASR
jgi:hypothetical protein